MSEEIQNGPFNLWQMFNAPTMVLFNNLENAADGLERLLMSILKLSGDYSEVLVPRSGTSQHPDEYYKSFNNWLIGRLFYVWSVKDLSRIHFTSTEAQTKILSILCINGASFYEDLHAQYGKILLELIDYYEENASLSQPNVIILEYFKSHQINVPDVQLNLEPVFVNVTNIETCKNLIDLTLQLLSKTITLNALQLDLYESEYSIIFLKVLHMFENFDMDLKLFSLRFFGLLIRNYDDVAITKFSVAYPNIYIEIISTVESFVSILAICYEKGEINDLYLESVNNTLLTLFKTVKFDTMKKIQDILVSVAVTVLQLNSKVFSKDLKSLFLSNSINLNLPEEIISLKHMTPMDINTINEYYTNLILEGLKNTEIKELEKQFYYKEVIYQIFCMKYCENCNIDDYLLYYHIEKACAASLILQRVQIVYDTNYKHKNNTSIISKENALSLVQTIQIILKSNEHKLSKNLETLQKLMEIVLFVVISHNSMTQFEDQSSSLSNFRYTPYHEDDVKCMNMKYFLLENVLSSFRTSSKFTGAANCFLSSLLKNKSTSIFKQIVPLSPLLLINNVLLPSKLIGDILMPAFMIADLALQKLFQESLSVITCVSLGSFAVILTTKNNTLNAHTIYDNGHAVIQIVCSKCHNTDFSKSATEFLNDIKEKMYTLNIDCTNANNINTVTAQRSLFAKFIKPNTYFDDETDFLNVIKSFSNHTVFNGKLVTEIFNNKNNYKLLKVLRIFTDNIENDENIESTEKEIIFNTCINLLVHYTKTSLERNDENLQSLTLDSIKDFGLSHHKNVLLPSTKLLVYFIMHPQCTLAAKAVVYLRDICKSHNFSPNQVYHRYKKDYCKLFIDCCLYNTKHFARLLLKVVRAFGFLGYRDFISKDVHHFLPYLLPYSMKINEVPSIIEEIASLVQCSVADFLIEPFPYIYTHLYLFENEQVAKKCYSIVESMTKMTILNLIKKHFRVILSEFLLQYCCDADKVLNACRYLAKHDPDESIPVGVSNMSTSQIADFLQPKFLGVLAYFDHKLVNAKGALSVKRKALQSFPHIMKLIGVNYLTKLRFKVLATLRSAQSLAKEFPKVLATAWSTFISNIDSVHLGPLLPNLAVSLMQQFEFAPNEINKIFQYLVLRNENLLSAHIPDLFFLSDSQISEKVKSIIKRHVTRAMPEEFLDKMKWYLQHLSKDIPNIKAYVFTCLDKLIRENRTEVHKAIFGGKNIDPVIVELIESLLLGCRDSESDVKLSSGACLGELGAIEAGHLPRQYVHSEPKPFAFSLSDDCFASTALVELTRACQYEKDTMNVHCYALSIQEILKVYDISPTGTKKDIWTSFPENMHQIMDPLLRSRFTLAYPSQPKKTHPLFGTVHASTYLEWAHNWTAQLIPLIEKESIRELLRTVHPSMRRDVRTLFLFIPYVLLHAIMTKSNHQYIQEEMLAVIGLENFHNENKSQSDKSKNKLLRHIRLTPNISSTEAEECNQSKCCKMIYTLLDFLNHWLLEWAHTKQLPLLNDNYKSISSFLEKFDKLTIAKGNFMCGEFERALQYLELYMEKSKDQMQTQLPFLAEIYAVLDEPDSIAGILSLQRTEPSLKQLILTQIVTGRLQDAAVCYERLAQEGQLDNHSLQGMVECYLGLDQPFTAYRLLNEIETDTDGVCELAAEPLWRLGRFEQLEKLIKKPVPPSRENWGLLMGRILLSFRDQNRDDFQTSCRDGMTRLLSQMEGEGKGESCLRNNYQTVFGLHIIKEAKHIENMLHGLKDLSDDSSEGFVLVKQLVEEWRRRAAIVQADVRSMEALLRCRRTLLLQTQEILASSHPQTVSKLKSCIGDLWLQSAKQARKADNFQQAYMYILNAEEYAPEELFIEKAKMYWARKQPEHAFTTLKRGLEENYPQIDSLTQEQRKICAKAKLLIAKYNDESTSVDVDVNIGYYKDAVDVYNQWEKSLVSLGSYYEKVSASEDASSTLTRSLRVHALNCYGKSLQYGHKCLYQSMPRMLSIWLDVETNNPDKSVHSAISQMTGIIKTYSEHLPLYLYLTAFSQIVSRICHPVKEVYLQLKAIIVKLILAYPQHTLWMMMSVIKSGYPQRIKRCQDVFHDDRLKAPHILKLYGDFTQLAEKLIELCNKPNVGNASTVTVSSLVRALPRLLSSNNFSHIMMPFQEYCKIVLPSKAARQEKLDFYIPSEPPVYIAGIEEKITILPSLQKPRKVALKGSDGKTYFIMLKPRDDLRKDFRLMEFNGVVNRFLHDANATRRRRLYLRTYAVLPLNEECGVIEWVPNLVGLRPILMHIYKQKGIHTSNRELKEMMCSKKDPLEKQRRIFLEQLLPRHPPVFQLWFRRVFSDPYAWYQARSAYIRTTAVISMVGYILGLGDRHGENISFDSTNGDTVHVDFNCLFNKGESFDWPERVPFRLTHNMEAAMGPLTHEGMFRKSCEAVMHALREQVEALMSVIGPFVYDPLVTWGAAQHSGERTNEQALLHLHHIRQRLHGMVRTKNKQLSVSLSPEGQVEHLIVEATSIQNLCQMYIGWGPFL